MTDLPPDPAPDVAAAERRKKLIGRAMVIGLGLLILINLAPMLISVFR